jgi:hypothetical protein
LRRFTGPTFSRGLWRWNKGGTRKTGPTRPPRQGGPAGPDGGRPRFLPEWLLFDFLLRSENFKGSLKKENDVPRVFLFRLFIWPNWELGNQSFQAIFCTHAAAIVSPRSLELKLETKEPSMEEAKRCELKLPVEIKRTAPHTLRRACPDRSYRISQPRRRREGPYARSKVGTHPRHEAQRLQGGVARA